MAYIEVDIDLDEFSNRELISELKYRIDRKKINPDEIRDLISNEEVEIITGVSKATETMVNSAKLEFLLKNIENIRLEDLEGIVK